MSHMHRSAVGRLSNEDGACLDESRRFVSRNSAAKAVFLVMRRGSDPAIAVHASH